ncbi:MAG: beta strand repeat-containing protein [Chthoniobacterales bacterium]
MTVPNGPADTATFDVSSTTNLTFSALTEVNGITFDSGASAYTINVIPPVVLTISGAGIVNNSGTTQNFITRDHGGKFGVISFTNSATAGNGNMFANYGSSEAGNVATTEFHDTSNAGTSTIINVGPTSDFSGGGVTSFYDQSSAAASTVVSRGPLVDILDGGPSVTNFFNSSTASNATLVAEGARVSADSNGEIDFYDQSTAENANITVQGGNFGRLDFYDDSTAANATITNGGFMDFGDSSSAGNATIVLQSPVGDGNTTFFDGSSSGGTAALQILGASTLDIEIHNVPGLSTGSIAGDGTIQLGQRNLTVGTNDQSTTFSGLIEDQSTAGSLSKVGLGTLTLGGANTYAAGTTVTAGTLLVNNTTGSATGTGPVQVNAGILGGGGIISGAVAIGTGRGTGAYLAPAAGTTGNRVLTVQSGLTLKSDATYTDTFIATAGGARVDEVIANGVTIKNATIALEGIVQGRLRQGTVLTLISNTGANPISGTFQNLPEGAVVVVDGNNLQASYAGGDGNDLTLTAVK